MSVLLEFNMIPTDQGESLSPLIARCMDVVERSGLPYKIGPMGTTIEGQTARDVLAVVERCLAELQEDCHRVEIGMSLDWRAGVARRLESQVHSVEEKVGHTLSR